MLSLVVVVVGCGTVAIQQQPAPPRTHRFIDPHGRPRAWGGGVCPVRGAHDHAYPPVPRAAFVDDESPGGHGWRDTRERVGFAGPHAWGTRRCTLSSFHEHVVTPTLPTR